MPILLEEIRTGNPDAEITVLVATGMHRDMTMDEIRNRFGENISTKLSYPRNKITRRKTGYFIAFAQFSNYDRLPLQKQGEYIKVCNTSPCRRR
jgi:hypothetical protein